MKNAKPALQARLMTAAAGAALLLASANLAPASAAGPDVPGLQNRTIGFALTSASWSLYQTENGKAECPDGFNEGPREHFKALYPNLGTVEDTQLGYESRSRSPMDKDDTFPYHEAKGKVGLGLNLDGKIGPNDFTSPAGDKGIDNQLYRVIGCTRLFRGPDGTYAHFTEMWVREEAYNRILVEVNNVDNLQNDDQVDVMLYRGKDRLMSDATGEKIVPGGSNRVDDRFSKRFTQHLKGKIVNGVLTTEPADIAWAWSAYFAHPDYYLFKQGRLQVSLNPDGTEAEGVVAGYLDVAGFYRHMNHAWSTHHSSYGGLSQPAMYRALHHLADAIPDDKGVNTAISSSLGIKLVQIFIQHPDKKVASAETPGGAAMERSQR
jgi:hypothetical protein